LRIIDANSGAELRPGDTFANIDGLHTLITIDEGLFRSRVLLRTHEVREDYPEILLGDRWVPLQVRYTHPAFLFQKVGFIPS
jgi:hypothetical protein